ncbi:MAG: hypothetical protein RIE08_16970 [Acidimicrobiales bacterium]
MSLWTPDGEHEVPRRPSGGEPEPAPPEAAAPTPGMEGMPDLDDLDPEERAQAEQIMAELAEARDRLAETPVDVVVANHVMGFYELAAIHLNKQPPGLDDARTAIDAMGAVLEALKGRLGEPEQPLNEALNQVRLAYVQLAKQAKEGAGGTEPGDSSQSPES